jgi:hypothetical protein
MNALSVDQTETVTCKFCGKLTPKLNYARPYCPGHAPWDHERIVMPNASSMPSVAPSAVAPAQPIGKVVAAEPDPEKYDSKTEARYAERLEQMLRAGEIKKWRHKPFKFRLADKTYYTPDFAVYLLDGTIEIVEVKGSWKAAHQEDSRVKLKTTAELFPEFNFVAVVPDKGDWVRESF